MELGVYRVLDNRVLRELMILVDKNETYNSRNSQSSDPVITNSRNSKNSWVQRPSNDKLQELMGTITQ